MTASEVVDTNVVVYAVGVDSAKQSKARELLANGVTVSAQLINETVNVLTRKQGVNLAVAHAVAISLVDLCEVAAVDADTIRKAIDLAKRYSLSHWDSLIAAAALLADCQTLYSDDFQHGQIFDNQLTVQNPFSLNP